jgi:hypothetical protein
VDNNLDDHDPEAQVIDAGHQFVILYSPWLRLGEGAFSVEYDPEANEVERFENSDSKAQGQLREIRKVLGTQLANDMSSERWIVKAVSDALPCRPFCNLTVFSL